MQISYTNPADPATSFFEYAEKHSLALFPVRADTKTPACENGFYDATANVTDWRTWQTQGHQLGISACSSGVVLIDVDAHGDRGEAWKQFAAWCAEIGTTFRALRSLAERRVAFRFPVPRRFRSSKASRARIH
jgi:hypothetical protein